MYKDNISSFEELLKKDKLAIGFFTVKNNLSNRTMCDIFETRNLDYNSRSQIDFIRTRVNTSGFRLISLKYLATKIWDIVPYQIMSARNINLFHKKIRNLEPKGCHIYIYRQTLF